MFIFLITAFLFSHGAFFEQNDFVKDEKKIKVLIFLSATCPCSKSHLPHINDLQKRFPQVGIYGVMSDRIEKSEDRARLEKYYLNKEVRIPIIEDQEQILVKKYGALKTPHVTILVANKEGIYDKVYEGGVSSEREFKSSGTLFLQENLQSLIEKQRLAHKNGPSLGCYIRRI